MAAPALVALAAGSRDARVAESVAALVAEAHVQRPDLRIEGAYLEHGSHRCRPGLATVVERLHRAGHDEIVVVPLELMPTEALAGLAGAVEALLAAHPGLAVRTTATLGHEPCFLEVLDERLRAVLSEARVRELDALVLAAVGSTDHVANQSVSRLARLWGSHHRLPVTAAYAASSPPATGEAVRAFRAQGRRHIAVASLFLTPGDLTDRAAELALEAGALAVSEPLGAHPEVARTLLARYAVGAVELVPV